MKSGINRYFVLVVCSILLLAGLGGYIYLGRDSRVLPGPDASKPDSTEECPFIAPELNLAVRPNIPLDSPENRAIDSRLAGTDLRNITAKMLGRDPQFIAAYPARLSFDADEDVVLHYAQDLWGEGKFIQALTIVDALDNRIVLKKELEPQDHPLVLEKCAAYYNGGCAYSHTLSLPARSLKIGSYYAFLTDDSGADSHPVFFNIHPDGSSLGTFEVLVVYPDYTWQAYNRFGGGSLYTIFRPEGKVAVRSHEHVISRLYSVSLHRPLLVAPGGGRNLWGYDQARALFGAPDRQRFDTSLDLRRVVFSQGLSTALKLGRVALAKGAVALDRAPEKTIDGAYWTQRYDESPESVLPFYRLLKSRGYRVAAIAQSTIHENPDILSRARLLVFGGHHEYWTGPEFDAVAAFVKKGGNIANFAGNVYWGRVNRDGANNLYLDQLGGSRPKGCDKIVPDIFKGTGFLGYHVFPATESLIGLAYRFAGYPPAEFFENLPQEDNGHETQGITPGIIKKSTGIYVTAPNHPVFAGLNTKRGTRIGPNTPILSLELDGLPMTAEGSVDHRFSENIPKDIHVLARGYAYAANRVNAIDYENSQAEYYGLQKPAIFVDTRPYGEEGGRVVSFGSIGFGLVINMRLSAPERIFVNTVKYLLAGDNVRPYLH